MWHTFPTTDKLAVRHNVWTMEETWRLVEERFSTRWEPGRDQRRLWRLIISIKELLKENRRQWMETEGEDVKRLLSGGPPLPQEAWRRIKGCYREAVNHNPPPAQITLEQVMAEHVEVYRTVPLSHPHILTTRPN